MWGGKPFLLLVAFLNFHGVLKIILRFFDAHQKSRHDTEKIHFPWLQRVKTKCITWTLFLG